MKRVTFLLFLISFTQLTESSDPEIEEEEIRANAFISILNKETEEDSNLQSNAQWDYTTNLTEINLKKKTQLFAEVAERMKKRWEELSKFNWRTFTDATLKRQFMYYSVIGDAALSKEEVMRLSKVTGDMEAVYSTAKICDFKDETKCDLELQKDITAIHRTSRNEAELEHVWVSWRKAVGPHIRHLYRDNVHLYNKAAHLNNFNSTDLMWLFPYQEFDQNDFKKQIQILWDQVKPLYQQLHAYVRRCLRGIYGDVVTERGPIPAHLLGNVWGQSWINLVDDCKPYPDVPKRQVTQSLKEQNFTVEKIFKTAEDFFTSIGLSPMTESFWNKSIFTKPENRDIVCHASAWDFSNKTDFRIKMCTDVNEEDFFTVHHEMGHIEYYMQYKDQPFPFRAGANPGFHEAIGDLISLSVRSPSHLKKLKLASTNEENTEAFINTLFEVAMAKIPVLPFSYVVDQWRWGVFSGNISYEDYNCKWWDLRERIQGLQPPVPRSEDDFDPGCKFHIPFNTPYIRYFVAVILEFQFHRSLCERSGLHDSSDPKKSLHMCDIYQNKEAGSILKELLKLGSSKPWQEALFVISGQRVMDASALLEYFRPLHTWMEKKNREHDVHIGWDKATMTCSKEEPK